ncbi:hypothetical protein ACTFIY_006323 [Dictyostelium cf. discoideum]
MLNGYCTEECKTKMKEIYKIAMEQFLTSTQRYFEDARIFEYDKQTEDSYLIYYENFFELKETRVDPIDGKYKTFDSNEIKVNPIDKGTKCDYDADHLPDDGSPGDYFIVATIPIPVIGSPNNLFIDSNYCLTFTRPQQIDRTNIRFCINTRYCPICLDQ